MRSELGSCVREPVVASTDQKAGRGALGHSRDLTAL